MRLVMLLFFTASVTFGEPRYLYLPPTQLFKLHPRNHYSIGKPIPFQVYSQWYFLITSSAGNITVVNSDGTHVNSYPRIEPFILGSDELGPRAIGNLYGNNLPILVTKYRTTLFCLNLFPFDIVDSVVFPTNHSIGRIVLSDLNSDGSDDIVFTINTSMNVCQLFVMDGNAVILPGFPITIPTNRIGNVTSVGDLDGDQVPEIIVETRVQIFIVNSNGTFEPNWNPNLPNGFNNNILSGSCLFEFDNSLGNEIVLLYSDSNMPRERFMLDIKNFCSLSMNGFPVIYNQFFDDNPNTPLIAVDLNNDGSKELFMQTNYGIHLFNNRGQYVPNWPIYSLSILSQTVIPPLVGDVDGDQNLELLFVDGTGHNFLDTSYIIPRKYDGSIPMGFPFRVNYIQNGMPPIYGDFNQDGLADLAQICQSSDLTDSVELWLHLITTNTVYIPSPWSYPRHDPMQTNCETTPQPVFTSVPTRVSYSLPNTIFVSDPYPNPFNSQTKIYLTIPNRQWVTAEVFDQLGRRVEVISRGKLEVGEHIIHWNPTKLSSGTYTIAIQSNQEKKSKKVVFLN